MQVLKLSKGVLLAILTVVFMSSCQGPGKEENPKDVAKDKNDAKFDKADEKDAQSVVDAYSYGMAEIKLADTVKKYATTKEAKDLAETVSATHKQLSGQLADIAGAKQISLPADLTSDQKRDIESMIDKKRSDFDKDYASAMVSKHKDEISAFEKCAQECKDPDIRAWFTAALPELRKNLDISMAAEEKLKAMAIAK